MGLVDPAVIAAGQGGASHLIAELARGLRQGLSSSAALGELLHHPRQTIVNLAHRLGRQLEGEQLASALNDVGRPFPVALARAAELEERAERPGVLLAELAPTVAGTRRGRSNLLRAAVHCFEVLYLLQLFLYLSVGTGFEEIFADIGADLPFLTVLMIHLGELVVAALPLMVLFSLSWRIGGHLPIRLLPEAWVQSLPDGVRCARRRFCAALVGVRALGIAQDDAEVASIAARVVGPGRWSMGLERLHEALAEGASLPRALAATRWFGLGANGRLIGGEEDAALRAIAWGKEQRADMGEYHVAMGLLLYTGLLGSVLLFLLAMMMPLFALVEMLG